MIKGLSHLTFIVQDLERASLFFTRIFDAVEVYSSGERTFSLSKEKFFTIGDLWIAVMEGEPVKERSYQHVAFKINDDEFEMYKSRVMELGLEVLPSRPRIKGEGRSLYFYDFDNHLFEMHTGSLKQRLDAYSDAVKQPELITIDQTLRLRAYDGNFQLAVPWYQDPTVFYNSEGITDPQKIPDEDYVRYMYEYLNTHGELYFIEILQEGKFVPIGDVTLMEENVPIVIGVPEYRGQGIGKKVMQAILKRAREIGIKKITGSTVYDYNIASRRLHESLGFKCVSINGNVRVYELDLETLPWCIR